jgi:hypothetical protein
MADERSVHSLPIPAVDRLSDNAIVQNVEAEADDRPVAKPLLWKARIMGLKAPAPSVNDDRGFPFGFAQGRRSISLSFAEDDKGWFGSVLSQV